MSEYFVENFRAPLQSKDIPIREICRFFRWIFANAWGQYLFYPSIGDPVSPQEAFQVPEGVYVDIGELDGYHLPDFPLHPKTKESALFWQDPEIQLVAFRAKLRREAFFSCLREAETRRLVGSAFGQVCSLRQAFDMEEWKNPHRYSLLAETWHHRDFEEFRAAFHNACVPVEADTVVFCFECWAKAPETPGLETLLLLMRSFCTSIPGEHRDLLALAELVVGSKSYQILTACGMQPISGSLDRMDTLAEGKAVVGVMPLRNFIEKFTLSKEEFRNVCRGRK